MSSRQKTVVIDIVVPNTPDKIKNKTIKT